MTLRLTNEKDWEFFNKGNANLIFKYVGQESHFKDKVLRLRLANQVFNTKDVYEFITTEMRPLLKDCAISTELVRVAFQKEYALNDGYGLLLPNLLSDEPTIINQDRYFKLFKLKATNSHVLEIKPKWLNYNDYGCRNCANHRYKFNEEEPTFCSIGLLNHLKLDSLKLAVQIISQEKEVQDALLEYLQVPSNVFQRLHALQDFETPLELLDSRSQITKKVCLQMTLRDVTVFIKIHESKVIGTIVTDIDPKSPEKWKKWIETEQALIQGGYYRSHYFD